MESYEPFRIVCHVTNKPREPSASYSVGAFSNYSVFVSFAEFSTKHQGKDPVNKLPFDECENVGSWNLVLRLHIEF